MKMKKFATAFAAVMLSLATVFTSVNTVGVVSAAEKNQLRFQLKVDGATSKKWKMQNEYYKAVKSFLNVKTLNQEVTVYKKDKLSFSFVMNAKNKKQVTKLYITPLPPLYRDKNNKLKMMEIGWDDAPFVQITYYEKGKAYDSEYEEGILLDKKNTYKLSPNEVYAVSVYFDTNGDGYTDEAQAALIVSDKYKAYSEQMTPYWSKSNIGPYFKKTYKKYADTFCSIHFSNGTKAANGDNPKTTAKSPDLVSVKRTADGVLLQWYKLSGDGYSYKIYRKNGSGDFEQVYFVTTVTADKYLYFVDAAASKNETYTYKIVAIDENGKTTEGKTFSIKGA